MNIESHKQKKKPLRVLIVDDSRLTIDVMAQAFRAEGYQVSSAATAAEALTLFERETFDLAVLDYHLPDGLGSDLLGVFRETRPDCVCLMITTDPDPELALNWLKLGAAAIIKKPFSPAYLLEMCALARRERGLLQTQNLLDRRTRELQQLETLHRTTIDFLDEALHVVDPDLKVLMINQRLRSWCEELGLDAELEGRLINEVFSFLPGSLFEEYRQVLSTGRILVTEEKTDLSVGTIFTRTRKIPILTGDQVTGVITVITDITERRMAESELLEQRRLIRTIVDTVPVRLFWKDKNLVYLGCNTPFARDAGCAGPKEVVGKHDGELAWKDMADLYRADDRLVIETGQPKLLFEEPQIQGADKVIHLLTSKVPLLDEAGRVMGVLGCYMDITRRKEMDEKLKESERNFAQLFRNSPVAVSVTSLENGTYLEVNTAYEAMTGFSREEIIGRTSRDILGVNAEHRQDLLEKLERDGRVKNMELTFKRKDGRPFTCLINSDFVTYGEKRSILISAIDITEQKAAEQERQHLQTQLNQAQKMESVGRLAGGVAHDFNNMLGVILGHAEMTLADLSPESHLYQELREIQKAAQRSADLTRQLLAFARKQTVIPKVIDLNEVVEGMLKMLRRLIGEDINLIWLPGRHLMTVRMDPGQVDQILANLCVNARDAIGGNGQVVIETGNERIEEAWCEAHPGALAGCFVRLTVRDNGCGMGQDVLDKLFEPFFTTKEVGKGTGLGLATVYGIVRQNNGFLDVISEPGAGSSFNLYLPCFSESSEVLVDDKNRRTLRFCRETILLVEDEVPNLTLTAAMLRHLGLRVLVSTRPSEAIELARAHARDIQLLVTDVVMPEMNGRELAAILTGICPGLKCLYMSGYTADVIGRHGVIGEELDFIPKPFSLSELAEKVHQVLSSETGEKSGKMPGKGAGHEGS